METLQTTHEESQNIIRSQRVRDRRAEVRPKGEQRQDAGGGALIDQKAEQLQRVVFQKWRWPFLYWPSKGIAVDKQTNDGVVHLYRFREADGFADQTLNARP